MSNPSSTVKPALNLDWIIDCDTHISEPPDLFSSRLPAKWHAKAPHVVRNAANGLEMWAIGEQGKGSIPIGHTAVAGWKSPFPSAPAGFDEIPKAAHDPHARLEYMDSLRIWAMALYPNVSGFGSQAFLELREPELMLACVRAYNDFLTDWCEPARERFIPISAMPFWDVEASVREIERCAKAGHKGVLFTGAPQDHGMPALASPHWNPLWECAQAHDLPISFHIGSGEFTNSDWTPERLALYGPGGINAQTSIGLFLENGRQIELSAVQHLTTPIAVAVGRDEPGPNPARLGPPLADALVSGTLFRYDHIGHFGPLQDPWTIARDLANHVVTTAGRNV